MAGTHSEERQSQRVRSTDGWMGGTGRGDESPPTEQKQPCIQHTASSGAGEKSAEMRRICNNPAHEEAMCSTQLDYINLIRICTNLLPT